MSSPGNSVTVVSIVQLGSEESLSILPELIDLLDDAVEGGASVGFISPLNIDKAQAYWRERIQEVARGRRVLLIARKAEKTIGTVQLALESQPNGVHRAEIQRLLVLREARRQGVGKRLVRAAEKIAIGQGRSLLILNTRSGDHPERMYRKMGYQEVGHIPDFAQNPDGSFNTTTILYCRLS